MFKETSSNETPDNWTGRGPKPVTTERTFYMLLLYGYNKEQESAKKIKAIKEGLFRAFNDNTKFIVDPLDPLDKGVINEHDTLSMTNAVEIPYYGIMVHFMEFTITVKDTQSVQLAEVDPVEAIVLTLPANGADSIDSDNVNLEWETNAEAANYGIQITTDITFNTLLLEFYGWPLNKFTLPLGLLESETTYYWRVSGRNLAGQGAWSSVFSFETA